MGHLVNPISFRLGASKHWNSNWSVKDIKLEYINLISSDINAYKLFYRFFKITLFRRLGFLLSHIKIIKSYNNFNFVVYFFNGAYLHESLILRKMFSYKKFQKIFLCKFFFFNFVFFEKLKISKIFANKFWNFKNQFFIFSIFASKKKIFLFNTYFNYFSKLNLLSILNKKIKYMIFKFFFNKIFNNFYIFNNIFNIMSIMFFFKAVDVFFVLRNFKFFYVKCLNIFKNLYKLHKIVLSQFIGICLLNRFFYFNFFDRMIYLNKRLLFEVFLCYKILIKNLKKKKSLLFKLLFKMQLFNKSNFFYFSDYIFLMLCFKIPILKFLSFYFKKIFLPKKNFNIIYKLLHPSQINAAIVCNYISVRLKQRFRLKEILNPILKYFNTNKVISGFRIICAGRFTKKEIATYEIKNFSRVPFGNISYHLDYYCSEIILKYSVCGIKVYLNKRFFPKKKIISFLLNFGYLQILKISSKLWILSKKMLFKSKKFSNIKLFINKKKVRLKSVIKKKRFNINYHYKRYKKKKKIVKYKSKYFFLFRKISRKFLNYKLKFNYRKRNFYKYIIMKIISNRYMKMRNRSKNRLFYKNMFVCINKLFNSKLRLKNRKL